ncbi:sensor histidine kinase [Campylobacter sp. MIT 12-8780]|uniref:sensor histidine kinase n=1 Tax=unclassified Campylobacter TaxID=2593542 RepID=UPI00115EFE63|nr:MULTISPECIES: HAMP domain-containing sensor histidine kinase [unclassified Campylobacter]NDJ27808.1 HAMP domain-containing histidine kinase [Campylobacter sp. MIT 19-121]TQR40990.1 sensor histidine kinase [Campylobacter sp. MIT 12-8780]
MTEAKWVIRSILSLYLVTTGIFLLIFFVLWYQKLYEELVNVKTSGLKDAHRTIVLSVINSKYTPITQACKDISSVSSLKFAILDEKQILCSSLDFTPKDLNVSVRTRGIYKNKAFYIAAMDSTSYYLQKGDDRKEDFERESIQDGALRTFVVGEDVGEDLVLIRSKVLAGALFSFLLIALVSYFLVKIAIKPLENKIKTLNSFIKDFTHEINTPLSVILLSIERLEQQKNVLDEVKFKRMKLAAKTLSQTYSDLIFYTFPDTISNEEEKIDMKELVSERLEYFKLFFEQKKLDLSVELEANNFLVASKSKINKMFDNLLNNAIKYNKKGGFIQVKLKDNTLSIKDSGCGIDEENVKKIFDRYARFNKDQGGFGIGLSLVQDICKEYKITIKCHSKLREGTEFVLSW